MHRCSCGKLYKRLKPFQEHRAVCEMIRHSRTDLLDETTIPSNRDMWITLKILIKKNEALEKKVAELSKIANKEKKKISVVNWLNENRRLEINYENWLKNINVNENDLENVFNKGFIEGISLTILNNLQDKNTNVIVSFEEKPNKLYLYENDKWRELMNTELEKVIDYFQSRIQKEFSKYNKKNADKLDDCENCDEWYKNIPKVTGSSIPTNDKIKKIKFKLYNKLKFNLNEIVEYTFS